MENYKEIFEKFNSFFNETADEIAHTTKFVQRSSKPLEGYMFIQVLIGIISKTLIPTLDEYCIVCYELFELQIKSSSFSDNFNDNAVEFLRQMFLISMKLFIEKQRLNLSIFNSFNSP